MCVWLLLCRVALKPSCACCWCRCRGCREFGPYLKRSDATLNKKIEQQRISLRERLQDVRKREGDRSAMQH